MAKQTFTIYKLHFTTPLHIGDGREDYSISLSSIASDTIYAALTSCLVKMGVECPEGGYLGCTLSSLFPFYQKDYNSGAILFFPKPLRQKLLVLSDLINAKRVKKVAWLDKVYFERVINGEDLFSEESDIANICGDYLVSGMVDGFDDKFISSQISPRVKVSRDNSEDAVPFYMDRVFFKDYSGLFFMAQGDTTLVDRALDLLQNEGIGTDRNVGNGFFEYEKDTCTIALPDNSEYAMSLSTFIPESKDQLCELIGDANVAFDLMRRGGWITSYPNNTIRKNVIYAFAAASVFSKQLNAVDIIGKMVDLRPELNGECAVKHPIWRCGLSIVIPIKL